MKVYGMENGKLTMPQLCAFFLRSLSRISQDSNSGDSVTEKLLREVRCENVVAKSSQWVVAFLVDVLI